MGETAFSRLLLYSLYFDTKCTIHTVAVVVVVALGSRLQCSTVCLTRHLMVGAICDEHTKQQRPVIYILLIRSMGIHIYHAKRSCSNFVQFVQHSMA